MISLLVGCTTIPSGAERSNAADKMALEHGWYKMELPADIFHLVSYVPGRGMSSDGVLTVYIEGDGLAWRTGSSPSDDPTPKDPVALKLAMKHPHGNAAYLARPCQYKGSSEDACLQKYWTGSRFAPEVITAEGKALDQLKARFNATRLNLVGYSGGGTVAALLAARRGDVDRLITLAGNLDHRGWTSRHNITPLAGSLNPPDYIDELKRVRQWHFVGSDDQVVPVDLTRSFARRFPAGNTPAVIVMPGFDHHCCWVERWSGLWDMTTGK